MGYLKNRRGPLPTDPELARTRNHGSGTRRDRGPLRIAILRRRPRGNEPENDHPRPRTGYQAPETTQEPKGT
ncbi:hypothetical protein BJY01DRAFT_220348 [Aspergillus pseudoustus]|uniref:Uncharacterized protein n=1 Tax=Aspergillus pseudoustus TaxID=1810923 RepID=A0ABR4JD10_9EURO